MVAKASSSSRRVDGSGITQTVGRGLNEVNYTGKRPSRHMVLVALIIEADGEDLHEILMDGIQIPNYTWREWDLTQFSGVTDTSLVPLEGGGFNFISSGIPRQP